MVALQAECCCFMLLWFALVLAVLMLPSSCSLTDCKATLAQQIRRSTISK